MPAEGYATLQRDARPSSCQKNSGTFNSAPLAGRAPSAGVSFLWRVGNWRKRLFCRHTRPFGYPPEYFVLVNFRASRGIKRLQRVRGPPEGWNLTPPEASFASGGPCIPLEGRVSAGGMWRDARPSRAPSFLLLSRDSDFMIHWSIRYPREDSLLTIPVDETLSIYPRKYENRHGGYFWG